MIDDLAKKIFETIRVVSVERLAKDLGVDTEIIPPLLPRWEDAGMIRVVKSAGCGTCAGCGSSGRRQEHQNNKLVERINLVSLIKKVNA
jgi:hypothetical protein